MNRPFCAFGALLAFLVLAMFAVSSTSRSTTVRVPPPRAKATATSRNLRGRIPVMAVAHDFVGCDGWQLCQGIEGRAEGPCGTAQARERLTSLRGRAAVKPSAMVTARIEVADRIDTAWPAPLVLDCRSHSDRVYDHLIYGEADDFPQFSKTISGPIEEPRESESEWLTVFRSLIRCEPNNWPLPQAGAYFRQTIGGSSLLCSAMSVGALGRRALDPRTELIRLRSLYVSFRNWLASRVGQLVREWSFWGQTAKAPTAAVLGWEEYAELIDGAAGQSSTTALSAGTSDAQRSVRFGGWLRHSAALSLNQMALFLQAASRELDLPRDFSAAPGPDTAGR